MLNLFGLLASLALGSLTLSNTAISADEAVARSIADPLGPIEAQWIHMRVCGSGEDDGHGYLNSFPDYRDRRSLNIHLTPDIRERLAEQLGADPVEHLTGERIAVFGAARQVRIRVTRRSDNAVAYYFQTHVTLRSTDDLQILDPGTPDVAPSCEAQIV